jgi:hypothetical protein
MEDQTKNELEKMLDQRQPELKKLLEQIRPELSPTPEIARALATLNSATRQQTETQKFLESYRSLQFALQELPARYLKDQIAIGGMFEQARSQLALASEFARGSAAIANAHAGMMEQFRIPPFEIPIFPKISFPEIPKIDWARTRKAHIDGVIRLADCGWTAPAWMSWPDISALGNASESEIDDYFLKSYLGSEDGELRSISTLLASSEMERWKNLLEEVFDCVQRMKYRICIPALISILEGFTAESICRTQGTSRRETNVSIALKRAKWHEDDNLTGLLWMSVVVFLDHLFAHSDFESATPSFINRHWILHGRSPTDWTASDALKLLNALATVHWLFE